MLTTGESPGGLRELSVPSLQLFCKSKTFLKLRVYSEKGKEPSSRLMSSRSSPCPGAHPVGLPAYSTSPQGLFSLALVASKSLPRSQVRGVCPSSGGAASRSHGTPSARVCPWGAGAGARPHRASVVSPARSTASPAASSPEARRR